jgi:flagellar motility protein MotE (MotC chaperone)
MQYLTPEELRVHLARLEEERARIAARLQTREQAGVSATMRESKAAKLERRLGHLIEQGQRILSTQR